MFHFWWLLRCQCTEEGTFPVVCRSHLLGFSCSHSYRLVAMCGVIFRVCVCFPAHVLARFSANHLPRSASCFALNMLSSSSSLYHATYTSRDAETFSRTHKFTYNSMWIRTHLKKKMCWIWVLNVLCLWMCLWMCLSLCLCLCFCLCLCVCLCLCLHVYCVNNCVFASMHASVSNFCMCVCTYVVRMCCVYLVCVCVCVCVFLAGGLCTRPSVCLSFWLTMCACVLLLVFLCV